MLVLPVSICILIGPSGINPSVQEKLLKLGLISTRYDGHYFGSLSMHLVQTTYCSGPAGCRTASRQKELSKDRKTPFSKGLTEWAPGLGPHCQELHLLLPKWFYINTDHPGKTEVLLVKSIKTVKLLEVI